MIKPLYISFKSLNLLQFISHCVLSREVQYISVGLQRPQFIEQYCIEDNHQDQSTNRRSIGHSAHLYHHVLLRKEWSHPGPSDNDLNKLQPTQCTLKNYRVGVL